MNLIERLGHRSPTLKSLGQTRAKVCDSLKQRRCTRPIRDQQIEDDRSTPNEDKLVDLIHVVIPLISTASRTAAAAATAATQVSDTRGRSSRFGILDEERCIAGKTMNEVADCSGNSAEL